MRGNAERQPYRHGVMNAEKLAERFADHCADHARYHDDRDRDFLHAAEFFRNAHADSRGDRLRQQGYVYLVRYAERQRNEQDGQHGRHRARKNRNANRRRVLFQYAQLFIERNGKADRGRREQIAEQRSLFFIRLVIHAGYEQKGRDEEHRDDERIDKILFEPPVEQPADKIRPHADEQAEKHRFIEEVQHYRPPLAPRRAQPVSPPALPPARRQAVFSL